MEFVVKKESLRQKWEKRKLLSHRRNVLSKEQWPQGRNICERLKKRRMQTELSGFHGAPSRRGKVDSQFRLHVT